MKRNQLCMFGIVSGIAWTLPMLNVRSPWTQMLAGVIAGVVVTFSVSPFLRKSSDVILVGLASFPLGAFVYGTVFFYLQMIVDITVHKKIPHPVDAIALPILAGFALPFFVTLILPLAIIVYPASILNVWLLFKVKNSYSCRVGKAPSSIAGEDRRNDGKTGHHEIKSCIAWHKVR